MRQTTLLAIATSSILAAPYAVAQSFNIDLNISGPPELGGGVPSDAFGAAANQPGRWNLVSVGAIGHVPLTDIHGSQTSVTYIVDNYGFNSGGGFNFAGNTGDYALLLNDAKQVGTVVAGGRKTFTFAGLAAGEYTVFAYAVHPAGVMIDVPVTVWEATSNQTQIVTGPMPGNSFAYLVTHSIHNVILPAGGAINIDVIQPPNQQGAYHVNGFQIVAVPEPTTWLAMITLSAAVLRRKGEQR